MCSINLRENYEWLTVLALGSSLIKISKRTRVLNQQLHYVNNDITNYINLRINFNYYNNLIFKVENIILS